MLVGRLAATEQIGILIQLPWDQIVQFNVVGGQSFRQLEHKGHRQTNEIEFSREFCCQSSFFLWGLKGSVSKANNREANTHPFVALFVHFRRREREKGEWKMRKKKGERNEEKDKSLVKF
jgi:hypothetical protein